MVQVDEPRLIWVKDFGHGVYWFRLTRSTNTLIAVGLLLVDDLLRLPLPWKLERVATEFWRERALFRIAGDV